MAAALYITCVVHQAATFTLVPVTGKIELSLIRGGAVAGIHTGKKGEFTSNGVIGLGRRRARHPHMQSSASTANPLDDHIKIDLDFPGLVSTAVFLFLYFLFPGFVPLNFGIRSAPISKLIPFSGRAAQNCSARSL